MSSESSDEFVELHCKVPGVQRTLFLRPDLPQGCFTTSYLALEFFLQADGLSVFTEDGVRVSVRVINSEFAVYLSPPGPYYVVSEVDVLRCTSTLPGPAESDKYSGSADSSEDESVCLSSLEDVLQYLVDKSYPPTWVTQARTPTQLAHWKRALRKRAQGYTFTFKQKGDVQIPVLVKLGRDLFGRQVLLSEEEV